MASEVDARAVSWMDGVEVSGADMRSQILGSSVSGPGTVRGDAVDALPSPAMKARIPARLELVDDGQNGLYPVELTAQTDLDVAASSSTLDRIDSVIAEVVDNGDATSIYRFRVLTGTPAADPVAPALPPSDQATAHTRRLADVAVRANAESNGNIRSQDVTYYTQPAILRPLKSDQASTPAVNSGTAATWIDFTSAQWPRIQVTIPPSGWIRMTFGAELRNMATDESTLRVAVTSEHVDSGVGYYGDFGRDIGGHNYTIAGRTIIDNWTGYEGQTIEVRMRWRASTQPASDKFTLLHGNLIVEPVL